MSEVIENNQIAVMQDRPLTAIAIRAQVNLVQEVMKAVMKEGTHFGTIPGTPKPSLWKPGAEVLAATFRIAVSYKTEDLSTTDVVRYRVTAIGMHQTTGIVMGEGMGECSSGEAKYKWRKATSRKEFDATPEDRRRTQYGYDKYKKQEYEIQQVRTEPADLANTILKMACKRAQVAMTLNVTAASDIFTQDIEDLPEELRPENETHQEPAGIKELPACTTEQFETNLKAWGAAIVAKRVTVDDVINKASTKYTLTDEQKGKIRALDVPQKPVDDPFVTEYSGAEHDHA